jgi:hypothetical protein
MGSGSWPRIFKKPEWCASVFTCRHTFSFLSLNSVLLCINVNLRAIRLEPDFPPSRFVAIPERPFVLITLSGADQLLARMRAYRLAMRKAFVREITRSAKLFEEVTEPPSSSTICSFRWSCCRRTGYPSGQEVPGPHRCPLFGLVSSYNRFSHPSRLTVHIGDGQRPLHDRMHERRLRLGKKC